MKPMNARTFTIYWSFITLIMAVIGVLACFAPPIATPRADQTTLLEGFYLMAGLGFLISNFLPRMIIRYVNRKKPLESSNHQLQYFPHYFAFITASFFLSAVCLFGFILSYTVSKNTGLPLIVASLFGSFLNFPSRDYLQKFVG